MTKTQVQQLFWSSFGLTAYSDSAVPTDAKEPYITYEAVLSSFDDGDVPVSASIWYNSKSLAAIHRKVQEISDMIGFGGMSIKTDTGYMWVKRQQEFARDTDGGGGRDTRCLLLNVFIEFIDK